MKNPIFLKQFRYTLIFTLISTVSLSQTNLQKDWNKPRMLCPSFEEVVGVQVSEISPINHTGVIKLYLKSAKKPYSISISNNCINKDETSSEETSYTVNSNVHSFNKLSAGSYNIKLSDRNGCSYQKCITLGNETIKAELVSFADVTCADRADGSVSLEVSGGTPPYSSNMGQWDNNRLVITGLAAGSHSVEIQDSGNNLPLVQQITVNQPEPLVSKVIWEKENECYGDSNGGADIYISGGTQPYTYSEGYWTGSVLAIHGYSAGTYLIAIDDANGCGPIIQEVVLTQPDTLVTQLVYTKDVSCFGGFDGEAVFLVTGGTQSYTMPGYELSDGLYVIDQLRANKYIQEAGDGWGCPFLLEFEINQPDPIRNEEPLTLDASAEGLKDGQVSITLSGGTPPYFANGEPFTGNTWALNNLTPGIYATTFTDSNNCSPFDVAFEIGFATTKDFIVESLQDNNPLFPAHIAEIRNIYPNPASSVATIELAVAEDADGSIDLYSLGGNKVAALYQGMLQAGDSSMKTFSVNTIPSGIYFLRITTGNTILTQKVIISR